MNQPRAHLRAFLTKRRATLARLRRVNEALSRWDEHDAAAAMPAALRPVVERPTLGRQALNELQRELAVFACELEQAWERRH
jgi:hypothetical protein